MNKSGALFVYDRGAIGGGSEERLRTATTGWRTTATSSRARLRPDGAPDLRERPLRGPPVHARGRRAAGGAGLQAVQGLAACPAPDGLGAAPTTRASRRRWRTGWCTGALEGLGRVRLDASTGTRLWSSGTRIGAGISAAATVANGQLLVAAADGSVYAFAPASPRG